MATKMAATALIALAIGVAGCGGSGPSASETRCWHDKQQSREAVREVREGAQQARETGSMETANLAAERGAQAIAAEAKDCK